MGERRASNIASTVTDKYLYFRAFIQQASIFCEASIRAVNWR
jgi:hypothetical protein